MQTACLDSKQITGQTWMALQSHSAWLFRRNRSLDSLAVRVMLTVQVILTVSGDNNSFLRHEQ